MTHAPAEAGPARALSCLAWSGELSYIQAARSVVPVCLLDLRHKEVQQNTTEFEVSEITGCIYSFYFNKMMVAHAKPLKGVLENCLRQRSKVGAASLSALCFDQAWEQTILAASLGFS